MIIYFVHFMHLKTVFWEGAHRLHQVTKGSMESITRPGGAARGARWQRDCDWKPGALGLKSWFFNNNNNNKASTSKVLAMCQALF